MEAEFSQVRPSEAQHPGQKVAQASSEKPLRTTLLAVLLQVSWPKRLTKQALR